MTPKTWDGTTQLKEIFSAEVVSILFYSAHVQHRRTTVLHPPCYTCCCVYVLGYTLGSNKPTIVRHCTGLLTNYDVVVLSLVSSCSTTKSRLVVWLLTLPPWNSTDDNNDMSAYKFSTCYRISSHKEHVSTTWLQGGCWHSLTITHHLDSTCRNGHVCDTHCKPSLVYLLQPMNFPSYVCGINAC